MTMISREAAASLSEKADSRRRTISAGPASDTVEIFDVAENGHQRALALWEAETAHASAMGSVEVWYSQPKRRRRRRISRKAGMRMRSGHDSPTVAVSGA